MIDYFALLDQPRRPWLDAEELKQIFHAKTLRAHPDAQGTGASANDSAFADLNEAYQVLRDPKRRLQHLLSLANAASLGNGAVPIDLDEFFPIVASLTREAGELHGRLATMSNLLARSLLRPRLLEVQEKINLTLETVREMRGQALVRLKEVDAEDWKALQLLAAKFAYLDRWIAELEEKQLQLAL